MNTPPLPTVRTSVSLATLRRVSTTPAEARSLARQLRASAEARPLTEGEAGLLEACDVIASEAPSAEVAS